MSALKSIALAIELAKLKRDQAQQKFVHVQKNRFFAQDQMDQLERYASDTETRWAMTAQAGTNTELMRHHYQFMERLRQAIALQVKAIADVDLQLVAARKIVTQADCRVMVLEHMLGRKRVELATIESRKSQKQMDEFASFQYARTKDRYAIGESL